MKSTWFKCGLVNNTKSGPLRILSAAEEPGASREVLVIYIVLFARTQVGTEATKMLLIIQGKKKGEEGSLEEEYH